MAYPSSPADSPNDIRFEQYKDERDMPGIVSLIDKDLSEPIFRLHIPLLHQQLARPLLHDHAGGQVRGGHYLQAGHAPLQEDPSRQLDVLCWWERVDCGADSR